MKLTASGVTNSAAIRRSPSFPRSASSTMTTIRPACRSAMMSVMGLMPVSCLELMSTIVSPRPGEPLDVAREHIHLEVHPIALAQAAEVGCFQRMGDEVHRECRAIDLIYRQADAVHRDRALARDVLGERFRNSHRQPLVAAGALDTRHASDPVHVPAHHVAAQAVRRPQRLFEIDAAARGETRGARESLVRHVGPECPPHARNDRQAGAVHRDAVADRHVPEAEPGGVHDYPQAARRPPSFAYRADSAHDPGKHYANLAITRMSDPTAHISLITSCRRPESSASSGSSNMPCALSPMREGAR